MKSWNELVYTFNSGEHKVFERKLETIKSCDLKGSKKHKIT